MRAKEYTLMEKCVEDGVMWGWQHAHKYVADPSEEAIKERIVDDVMSEICEWFDFEEPKDER